MPMTHNMITAALANATACPTSKAFIDYCAKVEELYATALKAADLVQDDTLRDVEVICSFDPHKASLLFREITISCATEDELMLSRHNVPLYPIIRYVSRIMLPAFDIDLAEYAQGLKSGIPRVVILNIVKAVTACINSDYVKPSVSVAARQCMLKTGRLIVMCLHGTLQYRELLNMSGFSVYHNNWARAVHGLKGADDLLTAVINGATVQKDIFDDLGTPPKRKRLPTFAAVANAASERDIYSQLHAIIGDDTLSRAQVKTVILALYASLDILFPDE